MMNKSLSPEKYLSGVIFLLITAISFLFYYETLKKDHFGAVPLNGDTGYYRNYGDWLFREVQDRDIFYHNIGHSIENARKADIILLGHSMLMWALREDQIKEFEKKHGVKIYNMGFAGVASGEFARRIAKRWGIKPKLWIINADDQAANFFSADLDDFGPFGKSTSLEVIKYGRIRSYLKVSGRNLRWRFEDHIFKMLPGKMTKSLFPGTGYVVWRSIENGNWILDQMPGYASINNPLIELKREQDCHANLSEIDQAKKYTAEMGGSTVLMLIPYSDFCPQRVRELANALQVETIIPQNAAYTTVDGGQHLDRKGATDFTAFFLASLEHTEAFKKIERLNSMNGIPNENHTSH